MHPERDGNGALRAALAQSSSSSSPQVTGYRFVTDLDDEQRLNLDGDAREAFNVKTDEEVRTHLLALVKGCAATPRPLQVSEWDVLSMTK